MEGIIMSNVITIYEPQFNPDTIIRSGQVFRMRKNGEIYTAFSGDYGISFTNGAEENEWKFCVSQQDWQEFWSSYFDLSTDYATYNSIIEQSNDDFLKNSLKKHPWIEDSKSRFMGSYCNIYHFSEQLYP